MTIRRSFSAASAAWRSQVMAVINSRTRSRQVGLAPPAPLEGAPRARRAAALAPRPTGPGRRASARGLAAEQCGLFHGPGDGRVLSARRAPAARSRGDLLGAARRGSLLIQAQAAASEQGDAASTDAASATRQEADACAPPAGRGPPASAWRQLGPSGAAVGTPLEVGRYAGQEPRPRPAAVPAPPPAQATNAPDRPARQSAPAGVSAASKRIGQPGRAPAGRYSSSLSSRPMYNRIARQDLAQDRAQAEDVRALVERVDLHRGACFGRHVTEACPSPSPLADGADLRAGAHRAVSRPRSSRPPQRPSSSSATPPPVEPPWARPQFHHPAPPRSGRPSRFEGFRFAVNDPRGRAHKPSPGRPARRRRGSVPGRRPGPVRASSSAARVVALDQPSWRYKVAGRGAGRARRPGTMPGCWSCPPTCASSTKRRTTSGVVAVLLAEGP